MQKLASVSLVVLIVALIGALFFGVILSSQMSAFYVDLLRISADSSISSVDMVKYMALLDKYQWAWYLPQLVGLVFAVIATIAGIVTFVLISRKTS